MEESEAKLQPGVAFRLQPDGQWKPEKIPPEVLKEAKFSGYLTIQGYRCTVFDTPDKNQWAQKSTGTLAEPEPTTAAALTEQWLKSHGARPVAVQPMRSLITSRVASRIAVRWLRANDLTTIIKQIIDNWHTNPPAVGDSAPIDNDFYLYVEDIRSVDGSAGEGTFWQVIKKEGETGEDFALYGETPENFDIEEAVYVINSSHQEPGSGGPSKTFIFEMPDDGEIAELLGKATGKDPMVAWDELGLGPQWEKLGKAFETAGAEVEESEDIVITCPNESEAAVRKVIDDAKAGKYGPSVKAYWNAAKLTAQAGGEDMGQGQQASVSSQIAARWLHAQDDITSQVSKKLERDGDDKEYDKAILNFVEKTRNVLPPIDKALEKAAEILLKTREKIEHKHPKVQDRYVQMFIQELAQKHRELEDMRKQLMRGLTVELDRYESEANPVAEA